MTVKELIKKLKELPQEDEIKIWGSIDDDGTGFITTKGGLQITN